MNIESLYRITDPSQQMSKEGWENHSSPKNDKGKLKTISRE